MVWHVRLRSEDDRELLIEYSYATNESCDGLLKYDKPTKDITVEKVSDGADFEYATMGLFVPLRYLLKAGKINGKKKRVCTG
jgi:hypothetical protein